MFSRIFKRKADINDRPIGSFVRDEAIIADAQGNFVRISPEVKASAGSNLIIDGENNYLDIKTPMFLGNMVIHITSNSYVNIGENCIIRASEIYVSPGSSIEIGANVQMNGVCRFFSHEPRRLHIGSGCLLAGNVNFWTSDMHAIFDIETNTRINRGKDIFVGDNVWFGQNALILKGSDIGNGSVIGANAVTTGFIPKNCIAIGSPARVLRRGIRWTHENS